MDPSLLIPFGRQLVFAVGNAGRTLVPDEHIGLQRFGYRGAKSLLPVGSESPECGIAPPVWKLISTLPEPAYSFRNLT